MSIQGWYYLHVNGDLIYKPSHDDTAADIRESDFAVALWPIDPSDRMGAWTLLVEAASSGANPVRIKDLASKWKCDDVDALIFAERANCHLRRDGNTWCATRSDFEDLQQSPAGFGETGLDAMAALCKILGYQPAKMWGSTFLDLMKVATPA